MLFDLEQDFQPDDQSSVGEQSTTTGGSCNNDEGDVDSNKTDSTDEGSSSDLHESCVNCESESDLIRPSKKRRQAYG